MELLDGLHRELNLDAESNWGGRKQTKQNSKALCDSIVGFFRKVKKHFASVVIYWFICTVLNTAEFMVKYYYSWKAMNKWEWLLVFSSWRRLSENWTDPQADIADACFSRVVQKNKNLMLMQHSFSRKKDFCENLSNKGFRKLNYLRKWEH